MKLNYSIFLIVVWLICILKQSSSYAENVFLISKDTTKEVENYNGVPSCLIPTGFSIVSSTQNSIVVRWEESTPQTAGFELAKIKKCDQSLHALENPEFISTGNTYVFLGLPHSTEFYIYLRRVCQSNTQGEYNYSEWIRISGRTTEKIPSDCGADTTLFSITNATHTSFSILMSPWRYLSATGRRILVRYRLTNVPLNSVAPNYLGIWEEHLIYNSNKLKIDNLFPGGTYEVYFKQLRNGDFMEYTKACAEVGPFNITLMPYNSICDYASSASINCIGSDFVTLNINGPALGYDSLRYLIAIKPAYAGNDAWQFYYHFQGNEVTISNLEDSTEYQISTFLIIGKSGYNYDHICSESLLENFTTYSRASINDIDGDGIPDQCDSDDSDGPNGDSDADGITNQNDYGTPQNPYPQMPHLECGQAPQSHTFDPTDLLENAIAGEIFFISDFPILLTQVTGGNGIFSGEGILGLPFQTKYLKVEFNNVKVSESHVIFEGVVNGVSNDISGMPNLLLDTITFGEERFCKAISEEEGFGDNGIWNTTNSEYNPLGFNQNNQYKKPPYQGWEPGDPYDPNYDPNGFTADGTHYLTGTQFNEFGCSQSGFNKSGQICDPGINGPYYWLESGTTTEGIALGNELKDTLKPIVLLQLSNLSNITIDSINLIKIDCNIIRDSMRTYFNNLKYSNNNDRQYIFGPADDWFKEGMSEKFKYVPENLGIELDRNPNEGLLEASHVDLYHCDKKLMTKEVTLSIINQFSQEPKIDELVEYLRNLIKKFTAEQVEQYKDFSILKIWISSQLDSLIKAELLAIQSMGSIFNIPNRFEDAGFSNLKPPFFKGKKTVNPIVLASNYTENENLREFFMDSHVTWQDIIFDYKQGREYIHGVNRAYYLEAVHYNSKSNNIFNNEEASLLPITISKDVMGRTYTLLIDSLVISPIGGSANVYIIINTTPSPDRIVFKAKNITFNPSGFNGAPKLFLETDISIVLSNALKMNIYGNSQTYVEFDCHGFKGMKVDGEIEFCRKYVIPLKSGSLEPKADPERVKAHFTVGMPSWGEFIVNLSIDPFSITKYDSIKWQANQIVFDFSSSITPSSIKFPPNYTSEFVQNNYGLIQASGFWRGLYLNNLTVILPKQFSKNSGDLITIGVSDVIFDDAGLTGEIFASPILSLCDGNLGGWAFSIDTFAIKFTKNHLSGSQISGLLNLPIFTKGVGNCAALEDCVKYQALILPENRYSFAVKPLYEYQADLWKATVIIDQSSEIEIKYEDNEFLATAKLNGSISINSDLGNNFAIQLPNLKFENLILRNKEPYFEPGIWDTPDASIGVGFGGFGLLLDTIKMESSSTGGDRASLKFKAAIILIDAAMDVFTAKGGFQMNGKLINQNSRQKWVFDGFIVNDVCINASFPGVKKVSGCLSFFGQENPHPTFGKGFKGKVFVDFQGIDVEVSALGVFGNIGGYKYFMIDALAKFNPGIGTGAIQLIGFGGGASYHMSIEGDLDTGLPSDIQVVDPSTVSLGSSLSNIIYLPNNENGMSIHATVVLALAKEEAFNINATFGVSFYSNGGLDKTYFKGTAKFMDKLNFSASPKFETEGAPEIDAQICAYTYISYDFQAKQLYGKFKVFIDAAESLEGEGEAEILIKPGYWFINIGTPQKPIMLSFIVPGLNINLLKVGFYFDIGKNIPEFPGLPSNVSALTGLGNIVANESLRRTGNGFATGAKFEATTGDLKFLIFFARFDLGLGFDLMVQDYGNATCLNNNGEALGINGWYASGQMWAYVHGNVGIFVRLWGKDRNFNILKISLAAAMQAKFPNPFYARGSIAGKYRILGGLVKGNCHFEFKIGEECQIEGGSNPNENQKIILDLSPKDSAENVYTMMIPNATFSIPASQNIFDGTDTWRVEVIYANITKNGVSIGTESILKDGNTTLEIKPLSSFPSNTWLKFKIKVEIIKNGNHYSFEEEEVDFNTGKSPQIIPSDNIKAAYPINGQMNYYKNEHPYSKGFILLKFGMEELLHSAPIGYKRIMKMTKLGDDNETYEFNFNYIESDRKVEFIMPTNLENNTIYSLEMINKEFGGPAVPESNNSSDENNFNNNDAEIPLVLYKIYFRTSKFNKFSEKIDIIKDSIEITSAAGWAKGQFQISEPLDYFELYGENDNPLINCGLNLNSNAWFIENKSTLKIVYNYFHGYNYVPSSCEIDLFTNTKNVFAEQDFNNAKAGFEESLSSRKFKLLQNGEMPNSAEPTIQYLDITSLNEFNDVWEHTKDKLIAYKTWKCSGQSNWSAYPQTCNSSCCVQGQGGSCCNDNCVFGNNNAQLTYIAYNTMPLPSSGAKFQILIEYNIPGHGITTSKSIEIIKP